MTLHIYTSNYQETLADLLKQQLFGVAGTPFDRRIVVAPSAIQQQWLAQQIAADPDLGICMGVTFINEDQCWALIASLFPAKAEKVVKPLASRLEVSLAIEQQLSADTKKQRRRRVQLSDALARLFERYGQFGGDWLQQWSSEFPMTDQQQMLWQTLFGTDAAWGYEYQWLDTLDFTSCTIQPGFQLHLFGSHFVNRLHQTLIEELSKHIDVNIYLLSPCQMFWTDELSGRERRRLTAYWQKRGASVSEQQKLGELVNDTNPLLAQLAGLARKTIAQLDQADPLYTECYGMPAAVAHHSAYAPMISEELSLINSSDRSTLLQCIQADMLLLRNPQQSAPVAIDGNDSSIQCHTAPSPMREVQIVYEQILHLLHQHAEDANPITAADIRILTPDLRRYAPFLQATFSSSNSPIALQLLDLPLIDQSPFVQCFMALLNLAQSRWEAPAVLEFFSSRYVQERHALSSADLSQLQQWIQTIPIYWGEDHVHREILLREAHCTIEATDTSVTGTWQHGLQELVLALTQVQRSSLQVDFSDAPLINTWITLIDSLSNDLRPLRDGTSFTMNDWGRYLQCLCQAYLSPVDAISRSHRERLFELLESLQRAGRTLPTATFTFPSLLKRLQEMLERQGLNTSEGSLDAVQACALRPHRTVPARVIILLGMEDGAFPRKSDSSPLDLLRNNSKADYCPTESERDRHLFVECLLNARDYLVISYTHTSPENGSEVSACLPVDELLTYVKSYYSLNEAPRCVTVRHPFFAFDPDYFRSKTALHNPLHSHYRAAQAYLNRDRTPSAQQTPKGHVRPADISVVSLRDLESACYDPAKLYLNKTLGIYLRKENTREIKASEPFTLPTRMRYSVRTDALRNPLEHVLSQAMTSGHMPCGIFGYTAREQIVEDLQPLLDLQSSTQGLQLLPRIQFDMNCHVPDLTDPKRWLFPAIRVDNTSIIGSIDHLTMQGILANGSGTLPDAIRAWPSLLALHTIAPYLKDHAIAQAIVFLTSGQTKESFITDPLPHLEKLITYLSHCLTTPSWLNAHWVKAFLTKSESEIAALVEKELSDERFNHLQWLFKNLSRDSIQPLISPWIAEAQALYAPLGAHWYRLGQESNATV